MNTFSEENYLKAIYKIEQTASSPVSTNAIADNLNTKPSSVTDMLKKLSDKELIRYKKYQGVSLTDQGKKIAINTIRKHRLWEFFLVNHLEFSWDEVHDLAEDLEHIHSEKLINNLEKFLGFPKFDPHGDPIPDQHGNIIQHQNISLLDLGISETGTIVGVKEHSATFLKFLEDNHLVIGTKVQVIKHFEFDDSLLVSVNKQSEIMISNKVSKNLYIQ